MKPNIILPLLSFVLFITVILFELSDAGLDWSLVPLNIPRIGWSGLLIVLGILVSGALVACIPFAKSSYRCKLSYTLPLFVFLYCGYSIWQMLDYRLALSEDINHRTAREDIRNGKIQYLYTGQPYYTSDAEYHAIDSLERTYGLVSVNVGGHTPGMDRYNEEVDKYLTRVHGEGWQEEMKRKKDSIRQVFYTGERQ